VLREHEAVRSIRTTETNHSGALRCGRSSMAEPRVVIPLVSVRLRPVTPERIDSITPLVAEMADAAVSQANVALPLCLNPHGGRAGRRPALGALRSRGRKACPFKSGRGDHFMQRRTIVKKHKQEQQACFRGHE
jgi:hypothetical protein